MKRIFLILLIAALCAVSLFAAEPIYCKWCGSSNFGNVQQLLASPCSKSPHKYHDAYEGVPIDIEKAAYTCKNCGTESRSFKQLILSPCSKSPRGYHEAL